MSYYVQPLGLDFGEALAKAKDLLGKAQPHLEAASELASDPYLAETTCRVLQLSDLEKGVRPRGCAKTPMGRRGGIGLRHAIRPLRGIVWARKHPVGAAAIAAGVVGGIFLAGYLVGRD